MERFWSKVDRSAGPTGCWPWTRALTSFGYGDNRKRIDGERRAHRIAWVSVHGAIPGEMSVLHHCDNRPCCNPAHLFLGDHEANMKDRHQKHRYAVGEQHAMARLSDADVRAMRHGGSISENAARFGISRSYAWKLMTGKNRVAA